MTAGARGIIAMLSHLFADRQVLSSPGLLFQRRYGRGWGRRRYAENVIEYPFSANHRRCSRRVRRYGEYAALAEETTAHGVGIERDATETAAIYVRYAV